MPSGHRVRPCRAGPDPGGVDAARAGPTGALIRPSRPPAGGPSSPGQRTGPGLSTAPGPGATLDRNQIVIRCQADVAQDTLRPVSEPGQNRAQDRPGARAHPAGPLRGSGRSDGGRRPRPERAGRVGSVPETVPGGLQPINAVGEARGIVPGASPTIRIASPTTCIASPTTCMASSTIRTASSTTCMASPAFRIASPTIMTACWAAMTRSPATWMAPGASMTLYRTTVTRRDAVKPLPSARTT